MQLGTQGQRKEDVLDAFFASVFRDKDLSPNLSGSLRVALYLRRCGQRDVQPLEHSLVCGTRWNATKGWQVLWGCSLFSSKVHGSCGELCRTGKRQCHISSLNGLEKGYRELQIIIITVSKHMKSKKGVGGSIQHGYEKGKSYLMNLTAFCNMR